MAAALTSRLNLRTVPAFNLDSRESTLTDAMAAPSWSNTGAEMDPAPGKRSPNV